MKAVVGFSMGHKCGESFLFLGNTSGHEDFVRAVFAYQPL